MRKRLVSPVRPEASPSEAAWLNLDCVAEVELTSEDASHPIESALQTGGGTGWKAAEPGTQTIRLLFEPAQAIRRIRLAFAEAALTRTQEYVLRWSSDRGQSFREIVRQQWNFSPDGATTETEDHRVDLSGVTTLELVIVPEIGGGNAVASLAELRIA